MQWYEFVSVSEDPFISPFESICQTESTDVVVLQSRMIVHAEATLTQVIFDHALRIRVKAETNAQSGAEESAQNSSVSASTRPSTHKQAQNLVGRLNNLVTTDMSTMFWGRDFLTVCVSFNLAFTFAAKEDW